MKKNTALLVPISEHNIAQLYNCLASSPSLVVLLATKHYNEHRVRFSKVLTSFHLDIEILDRDLPEDAEDFQALCQFAKEALEPSLENYTVELNGTGGTKAITMALLASLPISKVYYKGVRHLFLQAWQPDCSSQYEKISLENIVISAERALGLYSNETRLTPKKHGSFEHRPQALTIANSIWEQYKDPDSAMSWLAKTLREKEWLTTKLDTPLILDLPPEHRDKPEWVEWITQLQDFSEEMLAYDANTFCITVQNSNKKKNRAYQFKRWLSGDWLEQLVENWLKNRLDTKLFLCDVEVSTTGEQGNQRELDFVCFHNTAGFVIETKVTGPTDELNNKMVQQVSSLANSLGKLSKILLLSPLFFQGKTEDQVSQFKHYCQGHGVDLCQTKEALLKRFV